MLLCPVRLIPLLAGSVMAAGMVFGLSVWPPSTGMAVQTDPCPVALEMAAKGMDLFEAQPEKGIAALQQAYDRCPSQLEIGYNLALAQVLAGRPEPARLLWSQLLQHHPDHLKTLANLAWAEFEAGHDEEALKLALRGLKQFPGELALVHTQMMALFRLGHYLDAYDMLYRSGLEGIKPRVWRDQAAGYVVEDLWQQFRRGDTLEAVRKSVAILIREYPEEAQFARAKDQLVSAAVDRDAEVPFENALPHQIWPKKGPVDEQKLSLDELIRTMPVLAEWKKRPEAFAVIIGVRRYKNMPPRPFADRDAENVYQLLTRRGLFYGDDMHVRLRTNDEATLTVIEQDLDWLVNQGKKHPNAVLFLYYAGHGAPWQDRDGLLLPVDIDPLRATAETGYALSRLKTALAGLPGKEIGVVLESCFSDSPACRNSRLSPAQRIGPASGHMGTPMAFGGGKAWAVAAVHDHAPPYLPAQQSAFSYFLLRGLLGDADGLLDGQRDGWVDLAEGVSYASQQLGRNKSGNDPLLTVPARLRLTRTEGEQ
jgi:tetratricopeptide (TPR) repeat protein